MCRALSPAWAVGIAAILCCRPIDALTQETRVYELRVDSLAKMSRRAEAALAAYTDTIGRTERPHESVIVGPLRVLTDATSSALAREAAQSVAATLTPTYGAALASLDSYSFVVRNEPDKSRRLIFVGGVRGDGREYSLAVVEPRADVVARTLLWTVVTVLGTKADPVLMQWLGIAPPTDTASAAIWAGVRLALISAPAKVGRRCYEGDILACKIALGLVQVGDPATAWFDSTDRQGLVRRSIDEPRIDPDLAAMRARTAACVHGSDSACISVLRQFPALLPATPFAPSHRVTLVQLATALGGLGSAERLLLTPGTPSERIASAARIPTDSVVRLWQERVRDARVESNDMSMGIAASSMAWILACAALALGSSRWR